jgi:hypothetical protein
MWCDFSSKIPRRSVCVSSHQAEDFFDRDQRRTARRVASEFGWHFGELGFFGALDIAQMARDSGQPPRRRRRQQRQGDGLAVHDRQRPHPRQRLALDG